MNLPEKGDWGLVRAEWHASTKNRASIAVSRRSAFEWTGVVRYGSFSKGVMDRGRSRMGRMESLVTDKGVWRGLGVRWGYSDWEGERAKHLGESHQLVSRRLGHYLVRALEFNRHSILSRNPGLGFFIFELHLGATTVMTRLSRSWRLSSDECSSEAIHTAMADHRHVLSTA